MFDDNTQSIIVEGNDGYQKARITKTNAKYLKKVKKYRDKTPLVY